MLDGVERASDTSHSAPGVQGRGGQRAQGVAGQPGARVHLGHDEHGSHARNVADAGADQRISLA